MQHTGKIDAAADHRVSRGNIPGDALAGEGHGVQAGAAGKHNAVDGHFLAGMHRQNAANFHFLRVNGLQTVSHHQIGTVRPDVHEFRNTAAAFAHGVALEQLAGLIEEHYGDGLRVVAATGDRQHQSADGGHSHEEILVKHLPVFDAHGSAQENIPAHHQIGDHVSGKTQPAMNGQKTKKDHQCRGNQDPQQHLFLLSGHR